MTLPDLLPASRVPDPMTAPPLGWGVIGTGWIAERFVSALQRFTTQRVVAVGSRRPASAADFADRFAIPGAHGSYEALVADPQVDVVYVATPHNAHLPHALLALSAGRHVLVEKPLALNAREAGQIQAAAGNLLVAEAFWSLYTPKFDVLRQILDAGWLGDIRSIVTDNGEWFAPEHRIMRHDLAGGPMLDLGTYPFGVAGWVLGQPDEVIARGEPAPSGVNGQISAILTYPSGAHTVLHTSIFANTEAKVEIAGTAATLTIPGVFYRPGPFFVRSADGSQRLDYIDPIAPENAYDALCFQAAEVARRIDADETGTPLRPLADSIAMLQVMDEVRGQLGIVFNEER